MYKYMYTWYTIHAGDIEIIIMKTAMDIKCFHQFE